jgi:putative hydrolase of the HAD superfamily
MDHIKGVFFDLHGTLLLSDDVDAAWENWVQAFYREMTHKGATASLDMFKTHLETLFNAPEPEYMEPGMTLFMRRVKTLGHRLGVDIPSREVRPLVDSVIRVWHEGMYLDAEAKSVIAALRRSYKVGLVTNWEHAPRIHELLSELGIEDLFDTVVVSDEHGAAKPNPSIFHEALGRTGVSPGEAVYVGDMEVDVEGSINAGIRPVLIKRSDQGNWSSYSHDTSTGLSLEGVTQISRLSELLDVLGE